MHDGSFRNAAENPVDENPVRARVGGVVGFKRTGICHGIDWASNGMDFLLHSYSQRLTGQPTEDTHKPYRSSEALDPNQNVLRFSMPQATDEQRGLFFPVRSCGPEIPALIVVRVLLSRSLKLECTMPYSVTILS